MSPAQFSDPLATAFGPDVVYINAYARRACDKFYISAQDETDDLGTVLPITLTQGATTVCCDARTVSDPIWSLLQDKLKVPLCDRRSIKVLPAELQANLSVEDWNEALLLALQNLATPGTLRMAQPFLDPRLDAYYRIPASLSQQLNDKASLPRLIPAARPPTRLWEFPQGAMLSKIPWPNVQCLVKISGSCAGEGVFACQNASDWAETQKMLRQHEGEVIVERWIDVRRNLDVEFIVPADPRLPCRIIGAVEQVVGPDLKLLGGICRAAYPATALPRIEEMLSEQILPQLRALGWYGIGGFDVLVDQDDQPWFIDPNLRLTDFVSPLFHSLRNPTKGSTLILSYAKFDGTLLDFERRIVPLAQEGHPDQCLSVFGILDQGTCLIIHAGILFKTLEQLRQHARRLQGLGVISPALDMVDMIAGLEAMRGA